MTQRAAVRGSTSVSFAAGEVDLGEVAARLRAAGAEVVGPLDTPWFTTDLTFTDQDGNIVTLTAPRMIDQAAAQAWANDQITGDCAPLPTTVKTRTVPVSKPWSRIIIGGSPHTGEVDTQTEPPTPAYRTSTSPTPDSLPPTAARTTLKKSETPYGSGQRRTSRSRKCAG